MLVRQVEEKDIDQLINLCEQHAAYEKSPFNRVGKREKLFSHLFKETNELNCLIVESDDQLLGYATFMRQFSTWNADWYLYSDCLFLKDEIRGLGIGDKIMRMIKVYAHSKGVIAIQWQTPVFNERAIKFYRKLGAKSKKKERFFWT